MWLLAKPAPLYNTDADQTEWFATGEETPEVMALQADKARDRRDAASIAAQARELFEEWITEEEAGYKGEIPWEEFKREINAGRPPHGRPFRESSS